MGTCAGTNSCSEKFKKGSIQFREFYGIQSTREQQIQLDLPYRHYINPRSYIASSLPHTRITFKKGKRAIRLQSINFSSIIRRRESANYEE